MSINWNNIPHFTRSEFDDPLHVGSGDLIDGTLLCMLVRMRLDIGYPVILHGAVGGCVDVNGDHGHASNSLHLVKNGAKAVDFHINADSLTIREKCYYVLNSGFTGVGIYYCWKWDNINLDVGFHVDVREKERIQFWTCYEKGKYNYFLK